MAFASNPYYSVITIDHTLVGGALTDFVLYLDDLPADAFASIHSTGKDIRFSDATGTTELAFDLRAIDTGAGTCEIMVKVPSVSAVSDTDIRIWYGDHTLSLYAATDTYGRNAVYSNFAVAYGLDEAATGATGSAIYIDRTGGGNDGTDYVSATGKTGVVGDGQEFDGSNDYIELSPSEFQSQMDGTVMAWVTPQTVNQATIFDHSASTGTANFWTFELNNINLGTFGIRLVCRVGTVDRYNVRGTTVMSTGSTYHVAVSVDGSGVRAQVDGSAETLAVYAGSASNTHFWDDLGTASNRTRIGVLRYGGSDYRFFDGFIDELWVSSSALSTAYISTTYNNQNAAFGTFYTVGAKQTTTTPSTFTPIISWF